DRLRRAMRLGDYCDANKISTAEGIARRDAAEQSRREFLGSVGAVAAAGALAGVSSACGGTPGGSTSAGPTHPGPLDVGIVGAGLAGLVCADQLRINGVNASIYEGNTRVGGRQYSLSGFFPGQVVERGGELIDTSQKNMINYARTFGLT